MAEFFARNLDGNRHGTNIISNINTHTHTYTHNYPFSTD